MVKYQLRRPRKDRNDPHNIKQLKSSKNNVTVTDMKNKNQLNGITSSQGLFLQARYV